MNIINPGQLLPLLVVTLINNLKWNHPNYGHKKDVELSFSPSPISMFRPSHCPLEKISNRRSAHVRWYIPTHYALTIPDIYIPRQTPPEGSYTLFIYIRKEDVGNTKFTHANVSLHHRCSKFQSCEVWTNRQVTCWKRPFETGRTTGLRSLPSMSKFTARPH